MVRRLFVTLLASAAIVGCGSTTQSAGAPSPTAAAAPTSAGSSSAGGSPAASDAASIGRAFVDKLAKGDYAGAEAMEDPTMRSAAPASALGPLWQQITGQFGDFGGIGGVETTAQPPYTIATVQAAFANATVPLLVTVTEGGQVGGLHLGAPVPAGSPGPSASLPAYVNPSSFTETDATVGSAPWTLPGTLTMPKGAGPFPAVVLVAGSGPEDRDETIGPNKPLRDLAWGLASAGIASLRYDKRTLAYGTRMTPAQVAAITVKEEVIDDAIAAVALLRSTPGVDPSRVFLAGHSLGAYLAPRIAAQAPDALHGIAMLEAPSTPLAELILAQTRYLASLQASPDPSASSMLSELEAQVALAESADLSPSTPATDLPFGIAAPYWLDLRTYDPLATAASLDTPMFFSQGGRDYQVRPSELQPWQDALAGHATATFKSYPALNHLLIAGSGPSTPAEYTQAGHVAPELVADLAAWIAAR